MAAVVFFGTYGTPVPAMAACSSTNPGAGTTVTCSGAETNPVTGGAANVTVNVNAGATLSTGAQTAINLGSGLALTNNGSISSSTTTILFGGGSVSNPAAGTSITSSAGTAIQFNGTAGTAATVSNVGSINGAGGTAVDFGQSAANYRIAPGSSTTGSVIAGAGTTDTLTLGGNTGTGNFDSALIGTQYTGFDVFEKTTSVTWNLNGTAGQTVNWAVTSGTMTVTTNSLLGNVAISGGSLTFNQAFDGTYNGTLTGGGNVFKNGAGTVTFTAASSSTSATTVNAGTIALSANNNIGTGTLTLQGGALQYNAAFNSGRNILMNGGGGTINTNGFNATLSGGIGGSSSLTKTGAGTLTLSNAGNSYTGGTIINGGTVAVAANGALGNASSAITFNGGTLQATAAIVSARPIVVNAGNGTVTNASGDIQFTSAVTGAGTLIKTGNGRLILRGTNTNSGGVAINGGIVNITGNTHLGDAAASTSFDGGTLQFGGAISLARNMVMNAGNGTIDTRSDNATLSGTISGAGSLIKIGSGVLTLSGNNSYNGTIINDGSVLATANSNLGTAAGTITFSSSGTLTYGAAFNHARAIALGTGGGVINTNGFDSTAGGNITGAGALTKTGAGTLRLTGTNTYGGGTTVSGGVLRGNTAALQGAMTNNATVTFDQAAAGTFGGTITGTGAMIKEGAGTLRITGAQTYSGGTTVNAGRLEVDGSIGAVTIATGGQLGGSGTTGSVVNNGTLAPGNSIGTLNVTGNVTFNPGSTYVVEVDHTGASDLIDATGNIIINGGTVDARAAAGAYALQTDYTILQGASVTGTFTGVTADLAFLDPSLLYNASDVVLRLTRNDTAFAEIAADPQQAATADAVEELGVGNPVYNAFAGLSPAQAQQALDSLSGEHNAGLVMNAMASSAAIRGTLSGRVFNATGGAGMRSGISSGNESGGDTETTVWTEAVGTRGHTDAQGSAPAQSRHSGGMMVGADITRENSAVAGLFMGAERGEIYTDSQQANSDVQSIHAGLYAAYTFGSGLRVSGGAGGSHHAIDTTRHIEFPGFHATAHGETTGVTLSAYSEVAYPYNFGATVIEPFAGINVTRSATAAYAETGADAANLQVGSVDRTLTGHVAGLRAAQEWAWDGDRSLRLQGQLGWSRAYGDRSVSGTMRFSEGSTPFAVTGASVARDAMVTGLGAAYETGKATSLYADYDAVLSGAEKDHALALGVKVRF